MTEAEQALIDIALAAEHLRELLDYDPETGIFVWRYRAQSHASDGLPIDRWNTRWAGTVAGSISAYGYQSIVVNYRRYPAHRLAFLYMTGAMPPHEVDHINGLRTDNRWNNLRLATSAANKKNMRRRKDNSSGVTGVTWAPHVSRWTARISIGGRRVNLGYFECLSDAHKARSEAEKRHGYSNRHGS